MNNSAVCHEIAGCPGLYVDAFKGFYLRDKTVDPRNAFILTHYHGDHYGSLPREGKYKGPAAIHCTPVTAALLRTVHEIPPELVVEHSYGETWMFRMNPNEEREKNPAGASDTSDSLPEEVRITFYDANHCPGAAIVAVQFQDGTVHLHTGDMRYHEKMRSYPVIRNAVKNRKLDLVYLDTTYGHPKHDFVPQDVAVDKIAAHVHQLLGNKRKSPGRDSSQPKILVLLSCYSIGKEKVLWETSLRTNQMVYVTDRKLRMMQCIRRPPVEGCARYETECSDNALLPCSQIIERCTCDPNASDIHVIPMGLAGEMWPFFRPNYRNCVDYAEEVAQNYDKVVAFIPTGWANASNWNKKNAVNRKQLECRKSKRFMDVEIYLISYSEHSAFTELSEFVEFLRPRKIIPTVFSDEKDCRRIEKLFKKYIDSSKAKLQFFKSMQAIAKADPTSKARSTSAVVEMSLEAADGNSGGEQELIDLISSDEEANESVNAKDSDVSKDMTGRKEEPWDDMSTSRDARLDTVMANKNSIPLCSTLQGTSITPAKRKLDQSTKTKTPLITSFFSSSTSS